MKGNDVVEQLEKYRADKLVLSVADYIVTNGQVNQDIAKKLNAKGVTLLM